MRPPMTARKNDGAVGLATPASPALPRGPVVVRITDVVADGSGGSGGGGMGDRLIITIDGPAGTGKSTVARALAHRLGLDFLDTGAMYRAATAIAIDSGLDIADPHNH